MYVHMCVNVYLCMHVYLYMHTFTHTHIHTSKYTHISIHAEPINSTIVVRECAELSQVRALQIPATRTHTHIHPNTHTHTHTYIHISKLTGPINSAISRSCTPPTHSLSRSLTHSYIYTHIRTHAHIYTPRTHFKHNHGTRVCQAFSKLFSPTINYTHTHTYTHPCIDTYTHTHTHTHGQTYLHTQDPFIARLWHASVLG